MTDLAGAIVGARTLAAAHPGATLPCPACAASLQAANLDKHLTKVHAALLNGAPAEVVTLRGTDKWIVRPAIVLVIIWALAVASVLAMRVPISDSLMIGIGAPFAVVFTILLLAIFGVFRAQLVLEPTQLRMRAGLGLVSRTLVPAQLEAGSLIASEDASVTNLGADTVAADKQVGRYLRLLGDGSAITVGVGKAAALGKHWDPACWRAGGKRRTCEVMLGREQMVALEYWLAGRHLLRPRGG